MIKLYLKNYIPIHDFLEKQIDFINSEDRFVLYSGGVGSGKTLAGCYRALKLSLTYDNNVGLIGTQTDWQLISTTMQTFFEIINGLEYKQINDHLKSYGKIIFKNGSRIHYKSLDDESKLRSLNLGWFYIDEATTVKKSVWDMLTSRLRLNTVDKHYGFLTTNPDSKYHWIYREFIANDKKKNKKDYNVIYAKTTENEFLPKTYVDNMLCKDEDFKFRFVEGKWGITSGLVYKEFQRNIHVKEVKIDAYKRFFRAIDYGYTNPFCCLWIAINEDDDVYIFDEYYEKEKLVSQHFNNIEKRHEKLTFNQTFMDPSAAEARAYFNNNGILISKAINNVLGGIQAVKEQLLLKSNNKPKLFINPKCKNLISEMENYKWQDHSKSNNDNDNDSFDSEKKISEMPIKVNDHAVDALRYFIYSYLTKQIKQTNKTKNNFLISSSGRYDFVSE